MTFSPGNKLDCFPFFDLLPSLIFVGKDRLNRAEYRIINTVGVFGVVAQGCRCLKEIYSSLYSPANKLECFTI